MSTIGTPTPPSMLTIHAMLHIYNIRTLFTLVGHTTIVYCVSLYADLH